MAGKLAAEIRQQKPFEHIEEEATLNLVRTAEMLNQKATEFFRPFDLSRTQYNVLRILRGAGEDGLTCSATAERMVSRDPDITRLMDRMETRGLIARERTANDRRVVVIRLTKAGRQLVDALDGQVSEFHELLLGRLGVTKLRKLIDLLEEVREGL
jgi:MarR family transcriptional regulator, organic hydroperoxide resistance regulator